MKKISSPTHIIDGLRINHEIDWQIAPKYTTLDTLDMTAYIRLRFQQMSIEKCFIRLLVLVW